MFHIEHGSSPGRCDHAVIHTENIRLGLSASDVTRRTPDVLAQLALTLDHYSEGLFSGARRRRGEAVHALRRPAR